MEVNTKTSGKCLYAYKNSATIRSKARWERGGHDTSKKNNIRYIL